MNLIARYKTRDTNGRQHLVDELVDPERGRWLELLDGIRIADVGDGLFQAEDGRKFVGMIRG